MAIQVDKTLNELQQMAVSLGIYVDKGSGKNQKIMKEDLIHPIRNYFLLQRYKDITKIPKHLELILSLKSPMLAKRIDELKPELQEAIWKSDQWYFEEKLNGCRFFLVKTGKGLHLYSRHNSVTDLLPIEYSENIVYPENFDLDKIKDDFILDTEITSDYDCINTSLDKYGVQTETMLQVVTSLINCDPQRARLIQKKENLILTFNVFDCIYYNGSWILNEPLTKRRPLAFELWRKLSDAGFKIRPVRSNRSNKKEFYKGIILSGGEGCICKKIDGIYIPDSNRQNDGWIKIKRSMSEMTSMDDVFGDTIDGWISGFEPGKPDKGLQDYVGTIKVSIYIRKKDGTLYEHEIAHISGIDMKLRTDMTETVEGIPTLRASYYGTIVEIDGVSISGRAKRLNHATLNGFRYDKTKLDCVMDEEFLEKNIV
jgi:ATP-dependent DNA ligase